MQNRIWSCFAACVYSCSIHLKFGTCKEENEAAAKLSDTQQVSHIFGPCCSSVCFEACLMRLPIRSQNRVIHSYQFIPMPTISSIDWSPQGQQTRTHFCWVSLPLLQVISTAEAATCFMKRVWTFLRCSHYCCLGMFGHFAHVWTYFHSKSTAQWKQ